MSKIKVLPENLQNLIAAGEVIERPASVVKELVENSIDAESTDIRVEVLKGGKRLVKVSDNGIGMDKADAELCFQRHATSKLTDEADLFRIMTMGFRGEALSSIASVARVKLITGLRGEVGIRMEVSAGEIRYAGETSAVGTTMEVRDLFFNTPVRKKFLKTDYTELYHIIDTVTRAAVIKPDIGFRLSGDGREIFHLPKASGTKERILQIYGGDFLEGMIEVDKEDESSGIVLEGFISRRGNVRKTRANQFLFVNARPVMDPALRHAVYRAYEEFISKDDHPMFFLHAVLNPAGIDVNVHPAKREIRFLYKEQVYDTVLHVLRDLLGKDRSGREGRAEGFSPAAMDEAGTKAGNDLRRDDYSGAGGLPDTGSTNAVQSMDLPYSVGRAFIYLGDAFAAYPDADGLCIIDHHAAHERILYEKLREGIGLSSSRLLFPKQVRPGAKAYGVLLEHGEILGKMGIEIDDFGGDTVIVRALPEIIEDADLDGLLSDIAESIVDIRANSPIDIIKDEVAKRIACHGSVRGKKILGRDQVTRLINDLDKTNDPYHCPHGRPTRIYFSLEDLRKMFERT